MDEKLEIRKSKGGRYEIDYFAGKVGGKFKSGYHNILNPSATQLAIILIDLEMTSGLPILQAAKEYLRRRENPKDWLGL